MQDVSNISGTVASGMQNTLSTGLDNVAAMLTSSKADWRSWGLSALQTIAKVGLQMAAMSAGSALGSILGTVAGSVAGASAGSGSANNAFSSGTYSNLTLNAKGGVYDSPSLSSYSGQVYNSPQVFAFAKGAGVFGEAGPEAIMPLTRAADGSLGVRSVSSGVNQAVGNNTSIMVNAPVSVTGNGGGGTATSAGTSSAADQLTSMIQNTLTERLKKEISDGGMIDRLIKGRR